MDRTQVPASRTALVIVNSDVRERWHGPQHVTLDPQLRSLLQWVAASMADIPQIQLSPDRELQQVTVKCVQSSPPQRKFMSFDVRHDRKRIAAL